MKSGQVLFSSLSCHPFGILLQGYSNESWNTLTLAHDHLNACIIYDLDRPVIVV